MTIEIWIAVLGVLLLSLCTIWLNAFQSKKGRDEVQIAVDAAIARSRSEINNAISPQVTFCSSIDQVRSEAANLILRASDSFKKAVDHNAEAFEEGAAEPEQVSDYFVTIYGSASLGNESEAGVGLDDEIRRRSIDEYQAALDRAASVQIQFRRYISLMSSAEFRGRSPGVREEYRGWLKGQVEQLNSDPNYTLIVSPRAPQWGTSNTTFLTRDGLIEVKGHGRAAIVVDDQRIAVRLRLSLQSDVYAALKKNRREINRADSAALDWLKSELEGLGQEPKKS